jgi:hypothetical protein
MDERISLGGLGTDLTTMRLPAYLPRMIQFLREINKGQTGGELQLLIDPFHV